MIEHRTSKGKRGISQPQCSMFATRLLLLASLAFADEPALPAGLGGGSSEPALPAGLGHDSGTTSVTAPSPSSSAFPVEVAGFWDVRVGTRLHADPVEDDMSLGEARLQAELNTRLSGIGLKAVGDVIADPVAEDRSVDLERGRGWFDLRQLNATWRPASFADLKVGRQILTWGTGDLLFINDNFPKDWVAFFIGRDVEYLKAPSDAAKVSLFGDWANVDAVYTPRFDADRYISGERISYYNASLGRRAGEDAVMETDRPDRWFRDDEWAVRVYRNVGAIEWAVYGYDGFWKSPAGQTEDGRAAFPALSVAGASVRGPVVGGIGNVEVGCYDSRDDRDGADPMVRNSEWRFLMGVERDLSAVARDLTLGLQMYAEWIQDYDAYRRTLPDGSPASDEVRQVATVRLTKLLLQQNLECAIFAYYSPTDKDAYLRPRAAYKLNDRWRVEAGGNLFIASAPHTFFGQFEKNSNVYAALRVGF